MATVIFKALDGRVEVHCDAMSPKDAFKKIAMLQEMMSEEACGCCKSKNITFSVRTSKNQQQVDCDYYEMRCKDCSAQLSFGQHVNAPTLFKKNWDKEARAPMPNGGWYIYQGGGGGGGDGNYTSPGYQHQPQQGHPPQQQGGYPQQGGQQPQQGGWGGQQRQQPPMNPPPPQSGNDIPFLWLAPFIGITTAMIGLMA